MILDTMEQWENDLKNRENIVNNNIIKGFVGNIEKAHKKDDAVQYAGKGIAELSEDELFTLYGEVYANTKGLSDGNNLKLANQHLALIRTELSKRRSEVE